MKPLQFEDTLKKILIELSESTLNNLLENDLKYQESCENQSIAEAKYLKLDLSNEQREIVEKLLYWTEINDTEYSILSYLAGLYDGYKLYQIFKVK